MSWPNLLSLTRLLSVPYIIWLIAMDNMLWASIVFALAGLTDFLDGMLARLLKEHTMIGKYLDPLADKALLVGITVALNIKGYLPLWLVIMIVFRDLLLISGGLLNFMLNLKMDLNPLFISKLNTFVQIFMIAATLITATLSLKGEWMLQGLHLLTGFTTGLSGLAYVFLWLKAIHTQESRP